MKPRSYLSEAEPDHYIGNVGIIGVVWLAFALLSSALLELIGFGAFEMTAFFVAAIVALVGLMGLASITSRAGVFLVSARSVPAFFNGLANAGGLISVSVFTGLAGSLYFLGHDGLAMLLGLVGGFFLGGLLIAPLVRRLEAASIPDALARRFQSHVVRLVATFIVIACSLPLLISQFSAAGEIAQSIFGAERDIGVIGAGVVAVSCVLLGGMRSLTWTQVVLGIVLVSAFLLPITIYTVSEYGHPFAQLAYGEVLGALPGLERDLIIKGLADPSRMTPHLSAFFRIDAVNFMALVLSVAAGVAVFPHLVMRYLAAASASSARMSAAWSGFIALVVLITAPAYVAFVKYEVLSMVVGQLPNALPAWVHGLGAQWGLIEICGGTVEQAKAAVRACGPGPIRLQDVVLSNNAVVLAAPSIFGLPVFLSVLLVGGVMAALISTAAALLLAAANSFAHDIYYRLIDRNAPSSRQLAAARVSIAVFGGVAIYGALVLPGPFTTMAAWAFAFAASALFPVLAIGMWWSRAGATGAIIAMLTGAGVAGYYMIGTSYFAPEFFDMWRDYSNAGPSMIEAYDKLKLAQDAASDAERALNYDALRAKARHVANWWGIAPSGAAVFGLPAGLIALVLVSFVASAFRQPDARIIAAIRSAD